MAKWEASCWTGSGPWSSSRPSNPRRTGLATAAKTSPRSATPAGGGLQDQAVPIRVVEGDIPAPRRGVDIADLQPPGGQGLDVTIQVFGLDDQALERAGGHGREPGDQRDRGLPALGADLDPALRRPHLVIGHQVESERADVEVLGAVLVGDRQG